MTKVDNGIYYWDGKTSDNVQHFDTSKYAIVPDASYPNGNSFISYLHSTLNNNYYFYYWKNSGKNIVEYYKQIKSVGKLIKTSVGSLINYDFSLNNDSKFDIETLLEEKVDVNVSGSSQETERSINFGFGFSTKKPAVPNSTKTPKISYPTNMLEEYYWNGNKQTSSSTGDNDVKKSSVTTNVLSLAADTSLADGNQFIRTLQSDLKRDLEFLGREHLYMYYWDKSKLETVEIKSVGNVNKSKIKGEEQDFTFSVQGTNNVNYDVLTYLIQKQISVSYPGLPTPTRYINSGIAFGLDSGVTAPTKFVLPDYKA